MEDEERQRIERDILHMLRCSPRHTAHIANAYGAEYTDTHRKAITSLIHDDRISIVKDGYYELL